MYNPAFELDYFCAPSFERVVSTQTWHSIESLDQALIVAIESDDQVIVERQVRLGCCENKL